jgi:SAM-dependent methyltransferase
VTRVDPKLRYYPESRFGGFSDVDQLVTFYTRVRALIEPDFTVLDAGCGRGRHAEDQAPARRKLSNLQGACARLIGIDVDPAARQNPFVDEFRLIDADRVWPVSDSSVDLIVSDYVLEHVVDPELFFSECRRTIRPSGYLCMRTTNAFSYYGLAAKLTSTRLHVSLQRLHANPREGRDIFPTLYRCNTTWGLRRMLDRHGFRHCVYGFQSDPAHFAFSRTLYALGFAHQRYAPGVVKPAIFVFAQRRERRSPLDASRRLVRGRDRKSPATSPIPLSHGSDGAPRASPVRASQPSSHRQ